LAGKPLQLGVIVVEMLKSGVTVSGMLATPPCAVAMVDCEELTTKSGVGWTAADVEPRKLLSPL
jgi:hypothetical protein